MRRDPRFRDRAEAGAALAGTLAHYAGRTDVVVLGLARGGVPVAAVVAASLGAPLDVVVVRKVGVPGYEEPAMGAVGPNGITLLDRGLIDGLHLDRRSVIEMVARARQELQRREMAYRPGRAAPSVTGRTVIVVDDGLATGATMAAAVQALRAQEPTRIVVAVPVGAAAALGQLSALADEVVCVHTPPQLGAVGRWYQDFSATTDEQVSGLLAAAVHPIEATG